MSFASAYGTNRYEIFKNVGGLSHDIGRVKGSVGRYAKNVRRVPQVMFKTVKTGFASGFIGLSAQMGYVLGKAERIIDPSGEVDGERQLDKARTQKIASRWADSWKKGTQDGRHTMHLVASFPEGTPPGAVECIIRDTTEELLSQGRNRFEYIAAIHTDTDYPHGHIIVNRRNCEGEWFYLAREAEYTYDLFKDTIVKHAHRYGIELNNSSRLSRGLTQYPTDSRNVAMRGIEGQVLDFAEAPYKHQEKGSDSFFVSLQSKFGERTLWGVGLADVLEASGVDRGDTIRITHEGKRPIVVTTRDGKTIITHRNDWRIVFNGEAFGTFDDEKATLPTPNAVSAAEKRREIIVSEAGRYQQFADILRGAYTALDVAFSAAAETLRHGERIDVCDSFMEAVVSEAEITNDSDNLVQKIETAREQLDAVWHNLPNIAAADRPHVEERYFEALGDMECLLAGARRREFEMKAEGSVYSDEHRKKLAQRLPARSLQRLEQYGINRDEFTARTNAEAVSYMLESHWIERDAHVIATHMKLDMETATGREEAFLKAADLHNGIISDVWEKEDLMREDWERFSELRDQLWLADWNYDHTDDATAREDERNVFNAAAAAFSSFADRSSLHAQLASAALDDATDRAGFLKGYIAASDRHGINEIAARLDIDMSTREGRLEGYLAMEAHYLGVVSYTDTLNDIRDLAKKDILTFEESKQVIDGLSAVLGQQGIRELQNANSNVFRDTGIDVDKREALAIAEKYCEAMRQHGYDMEKTEQAIAIEQELLDVNENIEKLQDERQRGDEARKEELSRKDTFGL